MLPVWRGFVWQNYMDLRNVRSGLAAPISVHSLAILRIGLGLMLMWQAYNKGERLFAGHPLADVQFTYPFFGWVPAMPDYAQPLAVAWFLSGLFFAIGAYYRTAATAAMILTAWGYLISADLYLNHEYMEMIFIFLLGVGPAHQVWSFDAWRLNAKPIAARFYLDAMRLQLEIILVYAGLVKINSDWLRLQPLSNWLSNKSDMVFFGEIWTRWWGVAIGGYGIILLHVFGAPLLYWRRTRLPVFLLYCGFHITNSMIFPIDIFPWLTIICTTLFFAPDWPLRLFGRFLPTGKRSVPDADAGRAMPVGTPMLVGMAIFLATQAALPLRHLLYPGWVDWNDAGTRFSWRMMLAQRQCHQAEFIVHYPATGRVILPDAKAIFDAPRRPSYRSRLCIDGDILLQAAHIVRDRYMVASGGGRPEVHIYATKSLNFRKPALFADPTADLAAEPRRKLLHYAWQTDGDALPDLPGPFENFMKQAPPVLVQDMVKQAVGVDITHGYTCRRTQTPGRSSSRDIVCDRD